MKPRDAATLIITRGEKEVLLGVRSASHVFMPHLYVFPGGRVDPGDARVTSPVALSAAVESKLTRSVSVPRARALAMTAIRETFEETGLILGHQTQAPPLTRSAHWRDFFQLGFIPALDKLDYVARAITPPNNVRRFDARFFLADAADMHGELNGNGELEDLRWVEIDDAARLPLSPITELVLGLLGERLKGNRGALEQVPFYRELFGRELIEHE